MKKIKQLLKRAEKARQEKEACCSEIAEMLQPYFKNEITIDYQSGDGFCVIWENSVFRSPENKPIELVIEDIKDDSSCFL